MEKPRSTRGDPIFAIPAKSSPPSTEPSDCPSRRAFCHQTIVRFFGGSHLGSGPRPVVSLRRLGAVKPCLSDRSAFHFVPHFSQFLITDAPGPSVDTIDRQRGY